VATRKVNTGTTRKSTKPDKAPSDGATVVKIILLVGLIVFAGSFGVISYTHGFIVSIAYGQTMLVAVLMPAGVDGGLLVSAAAMIAPRTRAATRGMARMTFVICLAATLAQNGLYATVDPETKTIISDPGMINIAWSAVPGVIFVMVIETGLRLIRDMTRKTTERDTLSVWSKLVLSIKASRERAKRRERDAARRAAQKPSAKPQAPSDAREAAAWIKAQTDAQRATAVPAT
jgi:hypothetical protein